MRASSRASPSRLGSRGGSVPVLVEQFSVVVVGPGGVLDEKLLHPRCLLRRDQPLSALPVALRLGRDHIRVRYVELAVQDGVAGGIFVDIGRAVPDPLPGHEDGQLDVQLDLAHFKRSRVVVAHQVAYQRPVGGAYVGTVAVGYSGCLHDGSVVAHVIDDSDESVVEPGDRGVEYFFERWDGGAQRLVAALALLVYLVLLPGSHHDISLLRTVGFSGGLTCQP